MVQVSTESPGLVGNLRWIDLHSNAVTCNATATFP